MIIFYILLALFLLLTLYIYIQYKTNGPGRKDAIKKYRKTENDEVLTKAYDIEIEDEAGNTVRISDFEGKPTVINFWTTWCPPCKAELPAFSKLYQKYGDRINFVMLNLTEEKREPRCAARDYINKTSLEFPLYYDSKGTAVDYGLQSIPDTFFINKDGYIESYAIGGLNITKLENEILKLLEEKHV